MANVRNPRLQTNVENTVRGAYNDPVVIGSLVGALAIIAYADYKDGNFPPSPKRIMAVLLVYGILGVVTVSDNRLGRSFSVLILVGLVIKEFPSLRGKGKTVTDKSVPITNPGSGSVINTPSGSIVPGFDFPLPNPVAKSPHKPILPKKIRKGNK
jgi:hypothetical protein